MDTIDRYMRLYHYLLLSSSLEIRCACNRRRLKSSIGASSGCAGAASFSGSVFGVTTAFVSTDFASTGLASAGFVLIAFASNGFVIVAVVSTGFALGAAAFSSKVFAAAGLYTCGSETDGSEIAASGTGVSEDSLASGCELDTFE